MPFLLLWLIFSASGSAEILVGDEAEKKLAEQSFVKGFQVCGVSGTADERIKDCNKGGKLPKMTPKIYTDERTGEHHVWSLFTRTKSLKEVWLDHSNGLLWSNSFSMPDGEGDSQTNKLNQVADLCKKPDQIIEEKGFWSGPWSLPSKEEVKRSGLAGMALVMLFEKNTYYWTSGSYTSTYSGRSTVYSFFYTPVSPLHFSEGGGFEARPPDSSRPGFCVFHFKT